MKNCEADTHCKIEDSDLAVNSATFISNKEMKPYKEIHYNIYCAKDQPSALPPNTLYSRSCAINIITEGAQSSQPGMIRYELSVEDELDTHMMHLNHFSFVRLHPGQKKVYALTFSQPTQKAKALGFTLEGKFGNVEACLRINKLEGDCWQSVNIKADGHGFHEGYKRLVVNYTTRGDQLAGEYDLELKAGDMGAGLTVGAAEMSDSYDSPHIAREIKAGMPLSDHLGSSSEIGYYTFQLSKAEEAEGVGLIAITITPVSGKYFIAVRNDDTMPTEANYQWFTHSNEILIRKTDEFFKDQARYMIAVIPKKEGENQNDFRFHLKWSYLDKHDVMLPGVPNYGALPAEKKCFVAEILPSHHSAMFIKGGNQGHDVFISLGNENHLPQGSNYEFKITTDNSGVIIYKTQIDDKCKTVFDLKKYCNAYVCVFGKEASEFALTFVPDNNPITLVEGKVLEGPVPIGSEYLRFIYHPRKSNLWTLKNSLCNTAARSLQASKKTLPLKSMTGH